ncbi:site-specific DNA-methyltransferase [Cytobacillus sp. S13-E01]|uniref:site-specific DNA-methyltransferase n=1 Tax=Cytobacillus sp. S13-E01 TaxID=3031326 RepID=UPI0023D7B834|nr:site-specific DNA-methyltransferase [Cytobacillus sp. S13-E01]MDF0728903.1 site-specific DNA-methyltransferase [Cytobacillus sp. S13-E01]
MKLLQKSYFGKVKMIYIDPPYNTGNDFVYKDDFRDNIKNYHHITNQTSKSNTESNGRFHTDWLNMIYPRIKLAKNLLKEDGVLFVSIDEHEENNLTHVLNEIFGEDNKITKITWEKGRKNDSTFYSESIEYILVYAKNRTLASKFGKWRAKKPGYDEVMAKFNNLKKKYNLDVKKIEDGMKEYYNSLSETNPAKELKHFYRVDDRGLYFGGDISSASTSIPDYEVIHPVTGKSVKKPSRGWGCTEPEMLKRIADNRVHFGVDETTIPLRKIYLEEAQDYVLTPVIYKDGRAATLTLKELLGKSYFDNPKDHRVLKELIEYVGCEGEIILDFFSGSASTAHAVFDLNSQDRGNRKFIMVQLPEITDEKSEAYRAGYINICQIGKERIRRAGDKIIAETDKSDLDIGFKVFKLDSSNIRPWDPDFENLEKGLFEQLENIKKDRTNEDLLFEVLIKIGIPLTTHIEELNYNGKAIYNVAFGSVLICLENKIDLEIVNEIINIKPDDFETKVIFRELGFINDSVKTNALQILKKNGITDVRSV